jgi:hypothetical protein
MITELSALFVVERNIFSQKDVRNASIQRRTKVTDGGKNDKKKISIQDICQIMR